MRQLSISTVNGALAPYADGLRRELAFIGYSPSTVEMKVWLMACISRWLEANALAPDVFTSDCVKAFIADHRTAHSKVARERALAPMLAYLRRLGVIPPPTVEPTAAVQQLVDSYRHWLIADRGLAARTVRRYADMATNFLGARAEKAGGGCGAEGLSGKEVADFLLAECGRLTLGSAKGRVAELRSLLRFLYTKGLIDTELAQGLPGVAGWRNTELVSTLSRFEVESIINSIDRMTAKGVRDFAIVLLLARLGLRAAEVASLSLDDFDWHSGELVVHGKARRIDRLPLPQDVGEALATYLTEVRQPSECRAVFLTCYPPLRAMASGTVSKIVFDASRRVGIDPPVCAHRLRHALATDMLAAGANLEEISQVLRHQDLATTGVYAKVDIERLRQVARHWPGANR